MKNIELELKYKIGQEFDYISLFNSKTEKHRISAIKILYNNEHPDTPTIHYYTEMFNCNWWVDGIKIDHSKNNITFYKGLTETPYIFKTELKFDFGDIVMSGVNNINPNDVNTFKDSGIFVGNVLEITNINITITEDYVKKQYGSYTLLYDGFSHVINKEYHWPELYNEKSLALVSNIDIDTLLHIKCKEFSKKMYRDDICDCLYTKNGECIIDTWSDHSKHFSNAYTGLFRYLGVEDKAKELYRAYCDDRDFGKKTKPKIKSKNKEKDKLDLFLESLTPEEKEQLIKKLK